MKNVLSLLIFASFALCSVAQVYPKIPLGDDMYLLADDTASSIVVIEVDEALYNRIYAPTGYGIALQEVTQRIYQKFNDDFDHIFCILDNNSSGNTGISGVNISFRNSVRGIGRQIFDNTGSAGSDGKLNSIIYFPDYTQVIGVAPHELCHDYAVFLDLTYTMDNYSGSSHWEVCNAYGMLGGFRYVRKVEENSRGVAGRTYYEGSGVSDARNEDGSFKWVSRNLSANRPYSDIELYLMGMKSAQELRDAGFRLDAYSGNGRYPEDVGARSGYFYATKVTSYSIDDIIAIHGERIPDAASAKKRFKILTVVISLKNATTHYYREIIEDLKYAGGPADALLSSSGSSYFNFSKATHGRGSLEMDGIKNSLKSSVAIPPYLDAGITSLSFEYGEQHEFPVWTNTGWTVSSSASWLTVFPSTGTGDGTVTVTAAANTSSSARTATITVSGMGVTTKTIDVTQDRQPDESWDLTPTMKATLAGEGVLTVSTTQELEPMPNYNSNANLPPWNDAGSRIRTVVIEKNIRNISGAYTFSMCNNLTSITIPSTVSYINFFNFFSIEKLEAFRVDDDNNYYSSEAGVLYNKDKSILYFSPCNKRGSFTIPSSVETIADRAFFRSQLSELTIPNSVTKIDEMAFSYCMNLSSVVIPNSITEIAQRTFSSCNNLTSLIIPNSVTSIGWLALEGCRNLTSLVIPASVTEIALKAFIGSSFLHEVTVEWTTPLVLDDTDEENYFNFYMFEHNTLRVPAGTKALYEKASVWKDFSKIVEYGPGETANGEVRQPVDAPGLQAYASNGVLYINGLHPGESFAVYNLYGQLVHKGMATSTEAQVTLHAQGVHIVVATGGQLSRSAKVVIH